MIVSYVVVGYVAQKHAKEINQLERTATRLHNSAHNQGSYTQVQGEHVVEKNEEIKEENSNTQKQQQQQQQQLQTQESFVEKSNKWLTDTLKGREKLSGVNLSVRCLWREVKCAVKLSFILLCFVASWTPFMVLNVMQYR